MITLADGTSLDFEAKDHYDVKVELDATKQGSTTLEYDITVIIQVDDVLEPPAAPTITVSKNSTTPTSKIDVFLDGPGHDRQARPLRLRLAVPACTAQATGRTPLLPEPARRWRT